MIGNSLIATTALAAACAGLSIVVVLRRWAFAGEGIGHSGFGGAGTAWLLALFVPALDKPWLPYVAVVIFCVGTALAIGRVTRRRAISGDATVGVFLVATLAWGFLAREIYFRQRHALPPESDALLFGRMGEVSPQFALSALAISLAVIVTLIGLRKEIVAYCFDPLTAQTAGVRTDFLHDLLMVLLALVIVIGARVVGSVLVIALLVLPGAAALLLSRAMSRVVAISLAVALIGSVAGVSISLRWPFIPAGPAIVLSLFAQFLCAALLKPAGPRESADS